MKAFMRNLNIGWVVGPFVVSYLLGFLGAIFLSFPFNWPSLVLVSLGFSWIISWMASF